MTTDTSAMNEALDEYAEPIDEMGASSHFGPRLHTGRWWLLAILVSLILAAVLVLLWVVENNETPLRQQITNNEELSTFLDAAWAERTLPDAQEIRTGVFVQSLAFRSASDVHVSAYVWQVLEPNQRGMVNEGFIVPELVDSSVPLREEYRIVDENGRELIGWYLEGVVRQPFEYNEYPFDHKVVWLRLWPKDFDANVVLVPDFASYPCVEDPGSLCTGVNDRFGVEESIVLGEWEPEDTYFDFNVASYNTNFGVADYVGQRQFPELRFNVEIRRAFQSAFIINLVPLFVVAALGFGVLLLVTGAGEKASRVGFNTAGVLGTVSALFFVVVIAHVQLRTQFAGAGVVYLEYFYFAMYVALLAVAVTGYLANADSSRNHWVFATGDLIIPKLLYWPSILLAMVLLTVILL